jgi:hypothetical protein
MASARASRKKRKVAVAAAAQTRRWHPGLVWALQLGGKRVVKR